MKRILLFMITLLLTGCGPIIGILQEPSFKTTKEQFNFSNPLKIDKGKTAAIKRIAIPNLYDIASKEQDISKESVRIYGLMLEILIEDIKGSRRFEIVTPLAFKKKYSEIGSIEGNTNVMSDEEFNQELAKVGRALKCDAVLYLGQRARDVSMAKGVLTYGLVGTMDIPMTLLLKMVSTKDSKEVWYQEQEIAYVSVGPSDTQIMANATLKNKVSVVVKPLSANLLSSFSY